MIHISDSLFHSRAITSMGVPLANDPDPMVHQQLARLLFLQRFIGVEGRRVLEFSCGTGWNCDFMMRHCAAVKAVGFDSSEDAVALATQRYPGLTFVRADACDPALDIHAGSWDRVVSFEVLEHVSDMGTFLVNVRRHLAPDGIAFISTPNRTVFSLGHEPSPLNREHIKELTFEEFSTLLQQRFSEMQIWGQRFKNPELLDAWKLDVRQKIAQVAAGTRWQTPMLISNSPVTCPTLFGSVPCSNCSRIISKEMRNCLPDWLKYATAIFWLGTRREHSRKPPFCISGVAYSARNRNRVTQEVRQ